MSNTNILLKYDGPELAEHSMDVEDLAPALMAFGTLCKEANNALNNKRSSVKVMVNADIKANCVTISLDVIWSMLDAARVLIKNEDVATAKEIIEWLGIIGGSVGVFQFLKAKGEKPIESETNLVDNDGNNKIEVKFVGSNNKVVIAPEVKKLVDSHDVIKAAKGVVVPVANKQGVNIADFTVDGKKAESINKEEAKEIVNAAIDDDSEPQYITAHITVHEAFFDRRAKKWKFLYNGHVEEIHIGETEIASKILKRRKVVMGDTFKVKLEITERKTSKGYKTDYKVIELLDFYPGNEQEEMDI